MLQFGTFVAALGVSLWIYFRTKSYVRLILTAWGAMFIWSLLNCVFFPLIFHLAGVKKVFNYAPEMTGVAACGLAGWLFGIELAIIIFICRLLYAGFNRLFRKARPKA